MNDKKTAMVIGATGIIGGNLIRHLLTLPDWDVIGLSRGKPEFDNRARHIPVDLLDPEDCRSKLGGLGEVTHIFFGGYTDRPTWAEQDPPNTALLVNPVRAVAPVARNLRHVCLAQGTKYYGAHLGPWRNPAREEDPHHMPPNFYISQQRFLESESQGQSWTWSSLRPPIVCGWSLGKPFNLVNLVAAYATISKELGLPLRYPGKARAYETIVQAVDVDLLVRFMTWLATTPECANQGFNISNGDVFRWSDLWPKIAAWFDMPAGPIQTISLAQMMADKAPMWRDIVRKYGLVDHALEDIAHWPFGDYMLSTDYDMISDYNKIRRLGFHEFVDTEEMFMRQLGELRERRIIP
jgi:nucleoside-diphosphate-sugar epimerase